EGALVLGEAVLLQERRRGLAVDARHLALQPDQQARQGLDEGPGRLHGAPALQAERLRQKLAVELGVQDLVPLHAAGSGELQQQLGMAHRREVARADEAFLLGDVLQQEVLHVPVRAGGVDRAQPFREMADIVVVLLDPLAQQAAVELARGPGLAPAMDGRMTPFDRLLESQTKRTLGHGNPPSRLSENCIQYRRNRSSRRGPPERSYSETYTDET